MRRASSSPERLALAAAFLAAAVGLGGCGVADAAATTVEMRTEQRFAPASLTVAPGTTVVWHNDSTGLHTATAGVGGTGRVPEGADGFDSDEVVPGASWDRTLDEPGTYVVACRIHGDEGMLAVLEVEDR